MKLKFVKYVVVHSSKTKPSAGSSVELVERLSIRRGAFSNGYHFVILRDGTVAEGRSMDEPGNHTPGLNHRSLGICVVGGLDEEGNPADTRTPEQKAALEQLLGELLAKLRAKYPNVKAVTHQEIQPTTGAGCPGFNL